MITKLNLKIISVKRPTYKLNLLKYVISFKQYKSFLRNNITFT